MSTVPCPHCGGEIAEDAVFCRHCGSSDADGWRDSDDGEYEDDFDYDEFVEQNFGDSLTNTTVKPIWRLVAVVLVVAFLAALFSISF